MTKLATAMYSREAAYKKWTDNKHEEPRKRGTVTGGYADSVFLVISYEMDGESYQVAYAHGFLVAISLA